MTTSKVVKKKSIYPFVAASLLSIVYVSPFEAAGEFSIVAVVTKIFPVLYLILYMNSYLDSAYEINFNNKGGKGDKFWKQRRHLATGVLQGLACSAVGDFILLVRHNNDFYFVLGTVAFGLAHMCYISAMGFHHTRKALGLLLYVVAAVISIVVLQEASFLLQLVLTTYGALLVTSLWRAIDRTQYEDGRSGTQKKLLALGFLSFLASDLWIGVSTFLIKSYPVLSVQFILVTYYGAQGLIALAVS